MPKVSNELDFTKNTGNEIAVLKYGKEWPIVYMIYNDEEIYIGETVDASVRMAQHYENAERRKLKNVRIIADNKFNKSVILDLEAYLISHISADSKFKKLQNGNAGHQRHNYYQRGIYRSDFAGIWYSLRRLGLAEKTIKDIENDNLFKYSPYKTLTSDQYLVATHIIRNLAEDIKNDKNSTFIVNGGPGTGKTVLAIYLMKLLSSRVQDDLDSEDEDLIESLQEIHRLLPDFKIGIVVSMANLRETLEDVFGSTYGLEKRMVLKPSNVASAREDFDLLIVDEAHRLKAPRNMMGTEMGNMRQNNLRLGIDEYEGTQMDWIIKKSKHQIFFYDKFQSIKRTDIDANKFDELRQSGAKELNLDTQVRCGKGGQMYVDYIRSIFSDRPPEAFINFQDESKDLDYDFKIFDNVKEMTDTIRAKNKDDNIGLCRNVAGYSWPWKTKDKIHPNNEEDTKRCIASGKYDIEINGHKYIWNSQYYGWISTDNSSNEIGCIHTIQGFDLNYTGVIIGNDLHYDEEKQKLYIDRDSYFDTNGKNKTNDEDLRDYILNIYSILCTRGINGTYIYACDDGLRNYLKKYIKGYK